MNKTNIAEVSFLSLELLFPSDKDVRCDDDDCIFLMYSWEFSIGKFNKLFPLSCSWVGCPKCELWSQILSLQIRVLEISKDDFTFTVVQIWKYLTKY